MSDRLRLDFGNLPLVEVAIRASFHSAIDLKFSGIARLHAALQEDFPVVAEPQQYEGAPGIPDDTPPFEPGKIHGVMLEGGTLGIQCTLQPRVLIVRWARPLLGTGPEYPRFPRLAETLWQVFAAIERSHETESLRVAVVNMSYVNFIRAADAQAGVSKYISDVVNVKAVETADEFRKLEVAWKDAAIDLRFRVEKGNARVGDSAVEGWAFTTVAGTTVPPEHDGTSQLRAVHDRLQNLFRELISDRAKQEWGLKEHSDD